MLFIFCVQEEQLRVALIEYLRKHGSDNEKLQMVALNFGMPRELAKTMEDQAQRELARIKPKHLGGCVRIFTCISFEFKYCYSID